MAARRLFGAAWLWVGCWPRELQSQLIGGDCNYAKRPVIKGVKGGKGSVPRHGLKSPVLLTTHAMGVNIY